ncbi:RagB/SusD family nutrient uptake outer membrane protein [Hymenobacter sp. BT559]|uniref:RagB/SusD family nutrient uptake outer membrane protein n=1 Tax=Hymenobacter sp. BT559 TaxID=2795729 RepID=UPI0018EBD4DB|nr:RagB/SusD family nutrient uptake outer membrane protein [Hymenobacter sp. BT559]MBJ6142489.1 RagB/SusD family nutrient uptake outer membrane protein [Hymenobacter sp. BT559]
MLSRIRSRAQATALCTGLLLAATGCSDFLKEDNRSSLTQDNYFSNATQAQSAVDGLYNRLRIMNTDNGYGESIWVGVELMALHATTLGQSFNNNQIINQSIDPANPYFSSMWNNAYNGIGAANLAIARIPAVSMDETQKKALLGQAYFIRAFLYYHLVRLYGDVPLITTPIDGSSPDLYPTRAPQADVYNLIIADLQAAEQSGLAAVDRSGRISQGAVKALLSSVYLTSAGYPLQIKANYQKAADKAAELIDANQYPLFSNYASLHNTADKNQGELILQAQYAFGIATNAISALVIPYFVGISKYNDEFGAVIPTPGFYATHEAGDLRAQEQQFYFSKYPSIRDPSKTVNFGTQALYKYFHVESALGNGVGDENWTLLRMPEVMLIYAEAINEVSGPNTKAYTQINAIRSRAKLPALSGLSQDAFRTAVWKERYHELAYENKAYFDIQRTRQTYDVANNRFVNVVGFKGEVGPAFQEKYLLWGIPSAEINNNKQLTQNPGW